MNSAWHTTTTLADTEDVGLFRLADDDGGFIYRVRWNRAHTGRYAERLEIQRSNLTDRRATWEYIPGFLRNLEPDGRITTAQLLQHLAVRGAYSHCMCCGRPLREAPYTAFGIGPTCIDKLGATPRLVATLYRAFRLESVPGPAPAAGPGVQRGHLRLVAVNGRRIA